MSNRLLTYLPRYSRGSQIYVQLLNAENNKFTTIETSIEDINKQLIVDTATWGLAIYEKELGIKTILNKPFEERRSVIKSKMRGHGTVDAALIKLVVDSFTNGDTEVTFDGKINLEFTSVYGVPSNLQDALNAVEEIKPAHLDLVYILRYVTYEALKNTFATYGDLSTENIAYGDLMTYQGGN